MGEVKMKLLVKFVVVFLIILAMPFMLLISAFSVVDDSINRLVSRLIRWTDEPEVEE
jgi:hypothetical protein